MTWRERRKLSFLMNDFDDRNLPYTINNVDVAEQVIKMFQTQSDLVYPAKSYFVAIIYAKLLEQYFDIPFFTALSFDDLLIQDKFFKPYLQSREIYDIILDTIKFPLSYKSAEKTINYFKQEFIICS